MAEFIGCDHTTLNISNSEIARQFPEVIRHTERPILRTAPTPLFKLAELVRRSGFKVVLTGEGADEVFGGYDLFKEAKVRRFWARQLNSTVRPSLLKRLYSYLPGLQQQSTAALRAFFQIGLDRPDDPFFSHRPRWESCSGILQFFSDDVHSQLVGYHPIEELQATLPSEFSHWHPLSRAQYLEMAHLLPGYILSSQGDRVSMAHAVEGRFPFLDPRVVDFGAKLPPRMKLRGLSEKDFLRNCFQDDFPSTIVRRPKQPYRAPDHRAFFEAGAPDYIEEQLSTRAIAQTGYFDPKSVEKLVRKCKSGTPGTRDSMALVGILSVQLLHEQLIENGAAFRQPHCDLMRTAAKEDVPDVS
jgi:asparagine synthase (glutamine-hydrolysing)